MCKEEYETHVYEFIGSAICVCVCVCCMSEKSVLESSRMKPLRERIKSYDTGNTWPFNQPWGLEFLPCYQMCHPTLRFTIATHSVSCDSQFSTAL